MSKSIFEEMDGGFTPYRTKIRKSEKKILEAALADSSGAGFEPIAVSTQSVAGTNYHFFCNSRVISPNAPIKGARVAVYESISGEIELKGIKEFG